MPSLDAGRQAASWPRGCIPVAGSPGCSAGASPSIQTSDIPVPRTRPRPRPDSGSQSQTHAHRWPSPILGASAWPPTRSPGQPPGARSTPPVPKTRPLLPALHQAAPWPTSQAESGAGLLPRGLRSPRRGQDGKRDAAGGQRWCWQRGVASGGAPAVLPAHLTFRGGSWDPNVGRGMGVDTVAPCHWPGTLVVKVWKAPCRLLREPESPWDPARVRVWLWGGGVPELSFSFGDCRSSEGWPCRQGFGGRFRAASAFCPLSCPQKRPQPCVHSWWPECSLCCPSQSRVHSSDLH